MGCCLSCFTGQTDRKVADEISAPSRKASTAKRHRKFWSKLFRRSSSVTPAISLDEILAKHYGRSPEPDTSSSSVSSTKLSNTSAPCSTGNIGVDVPMTSSSPSSSVSGGTVLNQSAEDKEGSSADKTDAPSVEEVVTPPSGSNIAFSVSLGEDALQRLKPKLPPHLVARLNSQRSPRSVVQKIPLQERMALANKRRQDQSDGRRAKAQRFIDKHAEQMRRRLAAQETDN